MMKTAPNYDASQQRHAGIRRSLLILMLATLPTITQAADDSKTAAPNPLAAKDTKGWTGNLSFGVNNTSGNVNTKSANAGIELNRETPTWRYHVAASGNAMDVADTRVSERYLADLQADYVLPSKNYWFNYAGYDANKFAAIDKRFAEIFGYGITALESPKQKLGLEIGAGARQTTFTGTLGKENEGIGHVGAEYSYQLTDNTKFTENFVTQPGSKNTFTTSDTALTVGMSKNTSIKLNYGYSNNSKVFPGTKKTDTTSGVSLVVGF